MNEDDKALLQRLRAKRIDIQPFDVEQSTLTIAVGVEAAGRSIKAETSDGETVWYGIVDADGVALLTRSDLMPRRAP